MPLIVDGAVPTRWAERQNGNGLKPDSAPHGSLRLAFINNMPDAALEDTELQFFELINAASGEVPVYLNLLALPGVPRGERGVEHLRSFYRDFTDLWKTQFDAAIITGTEPRETDLRNEPYWKTLAEVFDWASRETASTILSCLAAHASVLHHDGIGRHRMPDKRFGVFESERECADRLTAGLPKRVRFPHSRWNEVREEDLSAAGYSVLTNSPQAGVDLFTKKVRRSLLVHFQGHPEYDAETLLKEYRRDIKRFVRGERETYPTMPYGYFDERTERTLDEFRKKAALNIGDDVLPDFPSEIKVQATWNYHSVAIYRRWVQYLSAESSRQVDATLTSTSASAHIESAFSQLAD